MVNKRVLALMIAATMAAQSQAGAYVAAAGTKKTSAQQQEETEANETDEVFGSGEESEEQTESGAPVILEDFPEEPIVYNLGEKAAPLKISVDCSGKPGYTWFQSVDNEHFEEILKKTDTDSEKDPDEEETEEKKNEKQVEDGEEYTPSTDKAGTF